ncbi:MAG: hypothetical protein M1541_03290, partial [Acidobacteria bacterium]|nr:hypothetical protein [Acidobacteriota bacterium]
MMKLSITVLLIMFLAGPVFSAGDYDVTPMGVKTVYAGHEAYLPLRVYYPSGTVTTWFYFDGIDELPDGVTAELFCNISNPCPTSPASWPYPPGTPFIPALRVTAQTTAVPGDYVLQLATHDREGNARTTAIPLRVLPVPEFVPTEATYQPPIPTLPSWEEQMTSSGANYCNESNKDQVFAFGFEGAAWYYDGTRVFYQIHDYTGQDIWRDCAENVARQYASYVNGACNSSGCGLIPAWRVFPKGLRMASQ